MSRFYEPYHRAAAARDAAGVLACMSDDIKMWSPTKKTPFEGKAMVAFLFPHLFEVLADLRFTDIVAEDRMAVLFFEGQIAGRPMEGCDVLRYNEAGLIHDFRVLIRPLPALAALNDEMGARLAKAASEGRLPV